MANFFHDHKSNNSPPLDEKRHVGRPEDPVISSAFQKTCEWLESIAEPKALQEIEEYMSNIIGEEHMCTRKWLQHKLIQTYQENISISLDGYRNIVCLKDMANRIINDKWYAERKKSIVDEKDRIILAAAKLIHADIREMKYNNSFYPDEASISSVEEGMKWLPKSVIKFLEVLISSKMKQNIIGQCLVFRSC